MVKGKHVRMRSILLLAFTAVWPPAHCLGQTAYGTSHHVPRQLLPSEWEAARSATAPGVPVAQANEFLTSDRAGWVDLMPQETFQGWTRVAIPPDGALDPLSQWRLDKDHRTLICEGNRGHEWLRYDQELANFLLHVEWRFERREGLKGYNSGVFIRNDRQGRVWHQAQVGEKAYIFGQTLASGNLSPVIFSPSLHVNPLHPLGEWNTYEIRCDGPKITLWVNGILTAEFAAPEVLKGYGGLEAEGYHIEFRNIYIKNIP